MRTALLLSLVSLLAAAGSVSAQVIYSDLGPGGTVLTTSGWLVDGINTGISQGIGATFTPAADATLGSIEVGIGLYNGTGSIDFALTTDGGGFPSSATPLETWSTNLTQNYMDGDLITLDSVNHPSLTAGVSYWLTAFAATPNDGAAWNWNVNETFGNFAFTLDGGSTWLIDNNNLPAFEVLAATATTPTPAALPAGLLLIAGLLCSKRLRKANA
jgi:hypothetical protein